MSTSALAIVSVVVPDLLITFSMMFPPFSNTGLISMIMLLMLSESTVSAYNTFVEAVN